MGAAGSPKPRGKYDHGGLLVSPDGTLVTTAPIDAALSSPGGATLSLAGVPAGTPAALYYVTVRAWSSRDAPGTLPHRQFYPAAIDLRSGASGALQLTID